MWYMFLNQIIAELKTDIRKAKRLRLSWKAKLFIVIASTCLTLLFGFSGRLEFAFPFMSIFGVLGLVIALKWKLRRKTWFWIAMTVIGLVHIALLFMIPWTSNRATVAVAAGVGSADFCLVLLILGVLRKVVEQSRPTQE